MAKDIEFADDTTSFAHTQQFQDIKNAAHEHLLTRIEELGAEFGRWSRQAIQQFVDLEIDGFVRMRRIPLNESEVRLIAEALTKELAGFGPIEDLLADPAVEDILINGFDDVYVSRHGMLVKIPVRFADNAHLLRIVRRILAPIGRRLDESNPMVDARLPDGGRVNVVIEPLSLDGPVVSIRKFRRDPLRPDDLLANGTFDQEICGLLDAAVAARCNVLVSGGTSSGKTSLLNALAFFIPKHERVVTIEDTAELSLNHPHVVRLESRPGGFDGAGVVSIRDLLRNTLRMRPDRIIVGEVRRRSAGNAAGHEHWPRRFDGHRPRELGARMSLPARDAGGVCWLPGHGVQPPAADCERDRLHRSDRAPVEWTAADFVGDRSDGTLGQHSCDTGVVPLRADHGRRRGAGQLGLARHSSQLAEACQVPPVPRQR